MPISAPKPCGHPGCGRLVRDGSGRCEAHQSEAWVKKPTAATRITGRKLQRLRGELFARDPLCAQCKRLGFVTLATQRDHIASLEEGGQDVEENTQGLCNDCHGEKSLAERLRAQARSRRN
jgi:5-methylcytosine-specific restriction protein A